MRIWAPSMPLPSEPSTRLSRVAPHDACLSTSTSGMPCLAKIPFSLATNSGAASVSAMKPSRAAFTSGPAACATCAPNGNWDRTAPTRAAEAAVDFTNWRRLMREELDLSRMLVIVSAFLIPVRPVLLFGHRKAWSCRVPRASDAARRPRPGHGAPLRPAAVLCATNSSVVPTRHPAIVSVISMC